MQENQLSVGVLVYGGKGQTQYMIKVVFEDEDFRLLIQKASDLGVTVGDYIHDTAVKAARRWLKRGKKGTPE